MCFMSFMGVALVMCGNFIEILMQEEKAGGSLHPISQMNDFADTLANYGLLKIQCMVLS